MLLISERQQQACYRIAQFMGYQFLTPSEYVRTEGSNKLIKLNTQAIECLKYATDLNELMPVLERLDAFVSGLFPSASGHYTAKVKTIFHETTKTGYGATASLALMEALHKTIVELDHQTVVHN